MKKINYILIFLFSLLIAFTAEAQKNQNKQTDSASPLHLMQPQYSVPYGIPEIKDIKSDLDRILTYLDEVTPAQVVNNKTGKEIADTFSLDQNASIK